MISGIGTDIVEVARVDRIYQKYKLRFISKILSPEDILKLKDSDVPLQLANHFAVKEATVKALGTGFRAGIYPPSIHLRYDHLGKPIIKVKDRVADLFQKKGITDAHVSISHDGGLILAFVVLERSPT